jgi:hypothetical protein
VKSARCCICSRTLNVPAVIVGRDSFGPKCARRAGLIQPRPRATTQQQRSIAVNDHDPRQADFIAILEAT